MSGIVLVGSGPSLTREDVLALAEFTTFAFNRSYIIFEEWGFSPVYYAALDALMVGAIAADIESKILPYVRATAFLEKESGERFGSYSKVRLVDYRENLSPQVSLDVIADCGTVGASSLQLVGALGFKKILLIGMDADYAQGAEARRTNHFHPAYSDCLIPQEKVDLDFVVRGWSGIVRLCASKGIEVMNASRRSALNYFPRLPLEEGLRWLRT